MSLVALGILFFRSHGFLRSKAALGMFALSGIAHGYAYGEAIVGAEPTPLVAYLVGFTLVQLAIVSAGYAIARHAERRELGLRARRGGRGRVVGRRRRISRAIARVTRVTDIYNYLPIDEKLATSGQPSIDELGAVAADGVEVVINLALHDDPRYSLPDEAGAIAALGMTYVHIPGAVRRAQGGRPATRSSRRWTSTPAARSSFTARRTSASRRSWGSIA